jgi:hypothetical protein
MFQGGVGRLWFLNNLTGWMRAPDNETWYERHAGEHGAVGRACPARPIEASEAEARE